MEVFSLSKIGFLSPLNGVLYIYMCCVCVFFSYSFCFSGRFKDVGLLVVMWRLEDFHHGC